jgi:hypothetical protein
MTIEVNGKVISTNYIKGNVSITSKGVFINGEPVEDFTEYTEKEINIHVAGLEGNISSHDGDIYVVGTVGNVESVNGDITVQGDVGGNVKNLNGDNRVANVHGSVDNFNGDNIGV